MLLETSRASLCENISTDKGTVRTDVVTVTVGENFNAASSFN